MEKDKLEEAEDLEEKDNSEMIVSIEIEGHKIEEIQDITLSKASIETLLLSIPSICGLILQFLVQIVNLIYIGQLNNPVLIGGVGLANVMIMVICISFCVGLNGAIDTCVSQAFGEKEYYLCGCYLNRGRIIQAVLFIPQALLFFLTKPLLLYSHL